MPTDATPGKPTTRRHSDEEKAQAVRLVGSCRVLLEQQQGYVEGLLRVMVHLGMRDNAPPATHRSVVVRQRGRHRSGWRGPRWDGGGTLRGILRPDGARW